jgi:hypothetical protein
MYIKAIDENNDEEVNKYLQYCKQTEQAARTLVVAVRMHLLTRDVENHSTIASEVDIDDERAESVYKYLKHIMQDTTVFEKHISFAFGDQLYKDLIKLHTSKQLLKDLDKSSVDLAPAAGGSKQRRLKSKYFRF